MKLTGIITTAAFFLLLGIAMPANARQEKQKENAAPAKQEQQAKPERQQQAQAPKQQQQRQQQAQAPKQQQQHSNSKRRLRSNNSNISSSKQQAPKQQQQHQQQQARGQQQQQRQQQTASSRGPAAHSSRKTATQRAQPALRLSARGSGRIPDERFRSNFGRGHEFRMGNPVMVGGYSRFQYGGFWFGFVQPWPAGWYYTDDVYIDYVDGGYYMYNPYYPGARFAISVVI